MQSPFGSFTVKSKHSKSKWIQTECFWGHVTAPGGVCAGVSHLPSIYSIGEAQILTLRLRVWLNTHLSLESAIDNSLCHIYSWSRAGECSHHAETHKGCSWEQNEWPGAAGGKLSSSKGVRCPCSPWECVPGLSEELCRLAGNWSLLFRDKQDLW